MPPPPQDYAGRQASPSQVRGYLMSHGGRLVGHPTHEALGARAAAGFLLQLCVWVALHPIISRAWVVVLWGEGGTERSSILLLIWGVSEEEKPVTGEQDVQGPCVSTTPQHTTWLVSTQLRHCSILQFQVQTLPQAPLACPTDFILLPAYIPHSSQIGFLAGHQIHTIPPTS